jgi:hypothetical protein
MTNTETYLCEYCFQKEFTEFDQYLAHMSYHETIRIIKEDRPFVYCPYCGQRLAIVFWAHQCGVSDFD